MIAPEFTISLPLAAAAMLIALLDRIPRRVTQWIAISVAGLTLACSIVLLVDVMTNGSRVVWVGGWHPGNRVGLGIALALDPAAACVATMIAVTVFAATVFSYQYFEDVGAIFYVLILAMLGAMLGFAYAADLFDLFVWYEVFSVAAYALAAYRSESESAYQGALQFALTNSAAGLFFLVGIILLEGRTGELNFVAVGHSLAAHGQADGLTMTALAFIAVGLFTRGALAPLHFWFDEVHAAAPAPLCAILSGAMAPLALYGFARIYWAVFARVVPPAGMLGGATVTIGALSAAVGTVLALRETRLKRKLAHATIAHSGVALAAIGEFTPRSLAAAATYEASYAAAAAALFFAVAIVRARTNEYDVNRLRGAGRSFPLTGTAFAIATLVIATLSIGGPVLFTAPVTRVHGIAANLAVAVGAGTGGAFGSAFATIFVRGRAGTAVSRDAVPWFLLLPALALASIAAAFEVVPQARSIASSAAGLMCDPRLYAEAMMHGTRFLPHFSTPHAEAPLAFWPAPLGAAIVTFLVIATPNRYRRLRIAVARSRAVRALVAIGNGDAGSYIAWIAGTAAVLAIAFAATTP